MSKRQEKPCSSRWKRATAWMFCVPITLCACGCGASDTQVVEGIVTLDGQPLEQGQIEFTPMSGSTGPIAGAAIENGHYKVPAVAQGLQTGGVYRVAITSMVGSGQFIFHPEAPGGKMESLKNIVPDRYNEESELQIEVSARAAENVHDFTLTSAPP
jgi:hypothetical protein